MYLHGLAYIISGGWDASAGAGQAAEEAGGDEAHDGGWEQSQQTPAQTAQVRYPIVFHISSIFNVSYLYR